MPEFAPGLPEKGKITPLPLIKKPANWELSVQRHIGEKAGEHLDLRLGNPETGIAHSWAIPKAALPKIGEAGYALALQQSDHTLPYLDYEGEIPSGYGKGRVKLERREQADVYHSDPAKIKFNLYGSRGPEEYVLRRVGEREEEALRKQQAVGKTTDPVWALHNVTKSQGRMSLPLYRPPYSEGKPEEIDFSDESKVLMPKMNGAHTLIVLEAGRIPRIFSHREPKLHGAGVIEHTHKVPAILKQRVPAGLGKIILRAEAVGMDNSGKAVEPERITGMLNSSVWNSRKTQEKEGVELVPWLFDVAVYRGKSGEEIPYRKKLEVLRAVHRALPALRLTPVAQTAEEKKELAAQVSSGTYPLTNEGYVEWPLAGGRPIKRKFVSDHDVYVRKVIPSQGKTEKARHLAGGFAYSYTPTGKIIGTVSGLDEKTKRDMLQNPSGYLGRAAKLIAEKKFPSGALSKPRFKEWHLDKGEQPMVPTSKEGMAKLGSTAPATQLVLAKAAFLNEAAKSNMAGAPMALKPTLQKAPTSAQLVSRAQSAERDQGRLLNSLSKRERQVTNLRGALKRVGTQAKSLASPWRTAKLVGVGGLAGATALAGGYGLTRLLGGNKKSMPQYSPPMY